MSWLSFRALLPWALAGAVTGVTGVTGCADPASQSEGPPIDHCFSCPAVGPPSDAPAAPLLITDRGADGVFRYSLDGHLVAQVAGATDAALRRPSETRRGPDGALYISSFGDNVIHRLDAGEATTFFGSSALEEPTTLFFADRDLYVLGNDTQNVVVIDPAGTLVAEVATELRGAHDMALGPDGLLYVATAASLGEPGCLQVWDPDLGERVAVFGAELERATALAFDAGGDLYVADYDAGAIHRYDPVARRWEATVATGLASPLDLAFDGAGRLHVLTERGVERLDDGALLIPIGPPLERPRSLTFL